MQVVHSRPCSQMLLPPHSTVAVVARAPVLAEAAAATLLALAALPPVLAEAAAATLLAVAVVALPPVLARSCCCRRIPCTGRAAARARSSSISCTSWAADHEGTVCHERPTNQAPRPNRRARRKQIPDPKREVWYYGIHKSGQEKKAGKNRKISEQISVPCREFCASAFADFCAAKEIPNRADHIPQALRAGKAEIWGSC